MRRYPKNFGRLLWKTAKYIKRDLKAIRKINEQTEGQVPNQAVMARVDALEPLVDRILVLKDADLKDLPKDKDLLKDKAALQLATEHPSVLGASPTDWVRQWLDLYIDTYLQVQQYSMSQPNTPRSSNADVE